MQPRSQGLFPGLRAGQRKGPGNEVVINEHCYMFILTNEQAPFGNL